MFFSSRKNKWIKYGKVTEVKKVTVNGNEYFIEVAIFDSYQEALSKTYKVVMEVSEHAEILEQKSDLYDWTSTIMRFSDSTIEVRNIRPEHKIIVVESVKPLSMEEFERDNAVFHYTH